MDRCERCDVTYDELPADQVPTVLREQPPRYAASLHRAEVAGVLRRRPAAGTWSALDDERLRRTAVYSWPETAVRTIAWIGRHTVHEALHHLDDIDRGIAQLRAG